MRRGVCDNQEALAKKSMTDLSTRSRRISPPNRLTNPQAVVSRVPSPIRDFQIFRTAQVPVAGVFSKC